jgi:hypothetical protein
LIEKSPAVSAERLTTSSPKREDEGAESFAAGFEMLFETSVPDQQVVIKGQKVTKIDAARSLLLLLMLSFKCLMVKFMSMI